MRRNTVALLSLSVVVGIFVFASVGLRNQPYRSSALGVRPMLEGREPIARERHQERMREAIPGLEGESEQPGSGRAEKFLAMAYPDGDIPLARLSNARAAAASLKGRPFPTGKGRPGTWVTVGPSQALYPATPFRNSFSYVPTAYVASGRATALAIDPNCSQGNCRLWVYAAGGGVWRTTNALAGQPNWEFLSNSFGIQSGSSITLDPNDPSGDTLYVGTGEANASGDSAAGVGVYKSTDGGDTWIGPLGADVFAGRAVGSIAVTPGDPNTVYAGTTRGVLGISSVSGGAVSLIPGAAAWGLYKSTDGGASWTFVHNGSLNAADCDTVAEASVAGSPCSSRGVRRVAVDPTEPQTVYAGAYGRGVWRSTDSGATWTQIKPSLNANDASTRPELAVTTLPNGNTRMYIYEGHTGAGGQYSRLFRSDDVATGAPVFSNLTSSSLASPGFGTYNLCGGQCWYDEFVYTPAGYPDIVYAGGSYAYGEAYSNKRAVVLSTDAGVSSTDMTMDATDIYYPNGLHPDQHALVTNPNNPYQFFEVNDGGLMRSSGEFADVSAWCSDPNRGLNPPQLARCQQLLSRVPTKLTGMNRGLPTLQFQSLSVSPFNVNILQGGTQDNGTWQTTGNPTKWNNTMIGDGGQSGFDAANPSFRFHTFYNATPDVNFANGDIADWNWIADQIFYGGEPQSFYVPIISDPTVSKTMFAGLGHVWRTKTWGMGTSTLAEFRTRCNEWFGVFDGFCGDWEPLGATSYFQAPFPSLLNPNVYAGTRLTTAGALYGTDRSGGYVVAVERATGNTGTLWAATQPGRVFISTNADAPAAAAVTFTRLDPMATIDPNRFVSGIHVDSADPNHALFFLVHARSCPTRADPTALDRRRAYLPHLPVNADRPFHVQAGMALDTLLQDLRYTARSLRRDAGFSLFAVFIAALGVGASVTVFSVVNALLLRPLPFAAPDRLVWIANRDTAGLSGQTTQVDHMKDLRERSQTLSAIAGYFAFYGVGDNLLSGGGGEPERLSGVPVTRNFFEVLGVSPEIGRAFTDAESAWQGPKAVMLSNGLWRRRFEADPAIVGRALPINGEAYTVVGVLPASFDFASVFAPGSHFDLYFPFPLAPETNRWGNTMAMVGRLAPGATAGAAQAEVETVAARITAEHPDRNGFGGVVTPLAEKVSGPVRLAVWVLAGAVGLVMLIVCANLASLLLARSATRQKEIAIRTALGAGRGRLLLQSLTEGLVLSGAGAAVGLLLAVAGTRLLAGLDAISIPLLGAVAVDGAALTFAVAMAIATGVIFGLAPALHGRTGALANALKDATRGSTEGRQRSLTRNLLVVAEIAFACVLLVGAGLLLRSLVRVLDVDMGFVADRAITIRVDPDSRFTTAEQQVAYIDEVLRRVRALPGVTAAGITDALPLGRNRTWGARAKGVTYERGSFPFAFPRIVSDGYVAAMGIPVIAGRDLTPADAAGKDPVMLVNESMARALWPGQDPIGQFVLGPCAPERRVVGVVGDVRHLALERESGNEMYIPLRQCDDLPSADLVVRSALPPASVAGSVRAALQPIAADLPNNDLRTLQQIVDKSVSPRRFLVLLLGGFALFALILASLGIYGLISYSVHQRTQEIGIRMALGASARNVKTQILGQTLRLAVAGVVLGAGASWLMVRAVGGLLFGVSARDPGTFLGMAAVLTVVALAAGYLPARRASRVDPMVALRAE